MDNALMVKISEEIRGILKKDGISSAANRIANYDLTEDELITLFGYLHTEGYDKKTRGMLLFESDNSEYLKLVTQLQKICTSEGNEEAKKKKEEDCDN